MSGFMTRTLLILCAVLVLGGCRPLWLQTVDPTGPPEYQLGWEDGCDTGLSAYGAYYYRIMYGFKKRPEMAANDQYKQGWNEGFTYCRFVTDTTQEPGDWRNVGMGEGF